MVAFRWNLGADIGGTMLATLMVAMVVLGLITTVLLDRFLHPMFTLPKCLCRQLYLSTVTID